MALTSKINLKKELPNYLVNDSLYTVKCFENCLKININWLMKLDNGMVYKTSIMLTELVFNTLRIA